MNKVKLYFQKLSIKDKRIAITFFFFLFNLVILFPYFSVNVFMQPDEFSALAVPAYFSGKDWSRLIGLGGFHGYGFTILLTPFFFFINNTAIIYKVSLFFALILRGIIGTLVYCIMYEELKINFKISFIGSFCYLFGTLFADDACGLSVLSEIPLAFIFLSITLFILKTINSTEKKKKIYSLSIGVLAAYSYTIHSRCIIIWGGIILLYIVYYFVFKKRLFKEVCFLLGFSLFFVIILIIDLYIKNNIYLFNERGMLPNDTTTVLNSSTYILNRIFNINQLKNSILIFFSIETTLIIISGGFYAIIIIGNIYLIKKNLCKRKNEKIFIISFLGCICVHGTNFLIALSSVSHFMKGDTKWLTYTRYGKPFISLLFIGGIYFIYFYLKNNVKNYFLIILLVTVSIIFLNLWMCESFESNNGLAYSTLNRIFYNKDKITVSDFLAIFSKFVIYILFLMLYLIKKKKIITILMIFFTTSLLINNQQMLFHCKKNNQLSDKTNKIQEIFMNKWLPSSTTIVCDSENFSYAAYVQFALPNMPVIPSNGLPQDILENGIFISDNKKYILSDDDYFVELEEGEYIITKSYDIYIKLVLMKGDVASNE